MFLQVLRLTQKERVLEERLEGSRRENTELKSDLASLHARLARHEQLDRRRDQQVPFPADSDPK